jgi:hypothetical protein
MHLGAAKGAMGGTNQGRALYFPPVPTSICTVEIASDIHTAPCGDGLDGGNLSNDLKVHDVSASSSSGLQIHSTYALVIPRVSVNEGSRTMYSTDTRRRRFLQRELLSRTKPPRTPPNLPPFSHECRACLLHISSDTPRTTAHQGCLCEYGCCVRLAAEANA